MKERCLAGAEHCLKPLPRRTGEDGSQAASILVETGTEGRHQRGIVGMASKFLDLVEQEQCWLLRARQPGQQIIQVEQKLSRRLSGEGGEVDFGLDGRSGDRT